jgi:hypothetical protein
MAVQTQVPNVLTSYRPALAAFPNTLYMAWKGRSGDEAIWWSRFDGNQWDPQQQVPNAPTSIGPALAVFNDRLHMAWKGGSGDEAIWWSSFDGTQWSPRQQVPNAPTSIGPALAALGNRLYMAWKGGDGDEAIWWSSFDGTQWSPRQQVPNVGTSIGPSLAAGSVGPAAEGIYMAWKGADGDETIWWSRFDGTQWSPQQQVSFARTSIGPALASSTGHLDMAWKGGNGDEGIWLSRYEFLNGLHWTGQEQVAGVGGSSVGPAVATVSGGLTLRAGVYMAWKGKGTDESIWWTVLPY